MQTHKRTAAQTIEPQDFLVPDPTLRRRPATNPVRATLIEDAVFEVVAAGPQAYRRTATNPPRSTSPIESELLAPLFRAARELATATEKRLAKLSPQAFTTLMASLFLLVFWICGGFSALNLSTSSAAEAPFSLVNTSIATQDANGMKVAMVTGGIRNTSRKIIDAPHLAIVTGTDQDILGTVMLSVDRIGPGVTIPFSGRFKLDGGKSSDIAIVPTYR